jgi:hypothetical protein
MPGSEQDTHCTRASAIGQDGGTLYQNGQGALNKNVVVSHQMDLR